MKESRENTKLEILNNETNKAVIRGILAEDLKYNHSQYLTGEAFYKSWINVKRISGVVDRVPIIVSEILLENVHPTKGCAMEIIGQFHSYNEMNKDRHELKLFVFAKDIVVYQNETEIIYENSVFLDGYLCKEPVFRKTPLCREITDSLIAVNRGYNKSDYIPCISWGKYARYVNGLNVGDRIKINGRIQSRVYFKEISPDPREGEYREAYELSISSIKK